MSVATLPAAARASLADVVHRPYWTDRPGAPAVAPPVIGRSKADLVIVGAGFTGLWTAYEALREQPGRDVLIVEAASVAHGATGRNGGFISASLTHGHAHGERMWPTEMPDLVRLGRENLAEIRRIVAAEAIAADVRMCGKTAVALTPHGVADLRAVRDVNERWGEKVDLLDADEVRSDVASPTYLGGVRVWSGSGLMDPARLAWGLREAVVRRGARLAENSAVVALRRQADGRVEVRTANGSVSARQVVLATNGFRPLLRRLRLAILPVFDHVLVTEPLTSAQRAEIGWTQGQGMTDLGNQFHYYRLTPEGGILWGGYDAIYHRGNGTDPRLEHRDASHLLLAEQFLATFPQLEGIRFTHKWAGIIDTTSRFTPALGTAMGGRVAYAVGYTGLGTASSRFGARVMLDLLARRATERTSLAMVRRSPVPFPPEPIRYPLVQFTRAHLAREDRTGRRGWWLSLLDRLGLGFTS